MKLYCLLIILLLILSSTAVHAQYVYKIKADSLLVTNDSCNAEFNLENHTRNVKGFLYNKGNGRTEFRSGVIKRNDTTYIVGNDTLYLPTFWSGLSRIGNVVTFGADTSSYLTSPNYIYRPTVLNQASYPFQWVTGYQQQFHVTNTAVTPFNVWLTMNSYIPMRVSHDLQGFLYLENNYASTSYNSPTFGILFGNRDIHAQKFNYAGLQPVTASLVVNSLGNGAGGSLDIPAFVFSLAGDTLGGNAVSIIGTGISRYGTHRLPTLVANYRLSIGGGNPAFSEGTSYPFTRFYANASSQPFVWKNLPWNTQTATIDTVLSIDYDGNVKQRQLPQILTATATLDFANTTTGNSSDLTISVTGAADGDVVALGVPNAAINAKSCYTAWVSAANTVTVRFNNYSSASINPASATFKVKIFK